jgi:hypothetical protein
MEATGIKPSAMADRRTLIRRVYLDMLGLPRDPEEVAAFIADKSPEAWDKVVDTRARVAAYGERWARHWMDLVRYADSEGFEFDSDRREMYRYRDYLIEAFNTDKPYDQFVKEQLAGDELRAGQRRCDDRDRLPALGPSGGGNAPGRARRSDCDDVADVHGPDRRLRALPQPQVRSDSAEGLLPDSVDLRADAAKSRIRWRPPAEVESQSAGDAAHRRLQRPLRTQKTQIEAPYLQMIVDREIAKLPEYMQARGRRRREQRTPGRSSRSRRSRRRSRTTDTTRKLVNETTSSR